MNIEMLSSEKLRVVLNTGDLDKYDLDYMSISSESMETRIMVKDILAEAKSSSGFTAKNCKLLIEVLPGKNNGCVLYLTKMPIGSALQSTLPADSTDMGRQTACCDYILSCGCLDDTIGAVNCFASYPDVPILKSSLFDFKGKYHLVFTPLNAGTDKKRLGSLLTTLSEFGQTDKLGPVAKAILAEHGKTISNNRAVEKMLRYFYG